MDEPSGVEEIMRALEEARSELFARRNAVENERDSLRAATKSAKEILEQAKKSAALKTKPAEERVHRAESVAQIVEARVARLEELLYVALESITKRVERP